jgi:hypothetical protein
MAGDFRRAEGPVLGLLLLKAWDHLHLALFVDAVKPVFWQKTAEGYCWNGPVPITEPVLKDNLPF